jgi:DNA-binding SARP family transcriptional activator
VDALKNNLPIRVKDTEAVKEMDPGEYANYKRLEVRSVLGVPYYKGSTGFLIVRNPKRYFFQLTPLVMTSYIVAAETNDIRLLLANKNQITSEGIRDKKDVIINMLGGMTISSYYGTIKENQISLEGIGRILAYLALRPEKAVSSLKLARELYPSEDPDSSIGKIKNLVYHFRKDYGILFGEDSKLISTQPSGYQLDPNLNVTTDCILFDTLLKEARNEQDIPRKTFLLRQAAKFYKGDMLPEISSEHWMMSTALHYTQKYLEVSISLCELLFDQGDYARCGEQALDGLDHIPQSRKLYYWLIRSMKARDRSELVPDTLKKAQIALDKFEYQLLLRDLEEEKK